MKKPLKMGGSMIGTLRINKGVSTFFALHGLCSLAWAANMFTAASGDWNTPGNWSEGIVPTNGESVVIAGNVSLTNSTAALAALTVNTGTTLTFDGWDTVLNATDVDIYGTVTHAANTATTTNSLGQWVPNARVNIVCSNLSVNALGKIDGVGKGYARGTSSSATAKINGAGPGGGLSGYNENYLGGGGSHGGMGGRTESRAVASGGVYGNPLAPMDPGSGGGAYNAGHPGYAGGGVVRIDAAGDVTIDGVISVNGENRKNVDTTAQGEYGAAGSAGSIYITCNTIAGAAGTISADGEDAAHYAPNVGPGGGGGRVAIVYNPSAQAARNTTEPPSLKISAAGGESGKLAAGDPGRAGTISMPDTSLLSNSFYGGEFIIPGFNSLSADSLTFANGLTLFPAGFSIYVTNDVVITANGGFELTNMTFSIGGNLLVNDALHSIPKIYGGTLSSFTLGGNLSIAKGAIELYADSAAETLVNVGGDLVVSNKAALYLYSAPTGSVTTTGAQVVDVGGDFIVKDTARVYPASQAQHGGAVMFTAANVLIGPTAGIDAKGLGFRGQETTGPAIGFGPGRGMYVTGYNAGSGAGHGGLGGIGVNELRAGAEYDSLSAPTQAGSSGGRAGIDTRQSGGSGGGVVWLVADRTATVDGLIDVSATDGGTHCGGGSGGSVHIVCNTFHGAATGRILANGGASLGGGSIGGGGAGGRIAIRYTPEAQAALATQPAVVLSADGGMKVDARAGRGNPGTIHLPDTTFFPYETLSGGLLSIPGFTQWTPQSLTVNDGWLRFPDGFALNVANNLTLTGTKALLIPGKDSAFHVGGDIKVINSSVLDYSALYGPCELSTSGNLTLESGGIVNIGRPSGLIPVEFRIGGNVNLAANTSIHAYGAPTNGNGVAYGLLMDISGDISLNGSGAWINLYSHPTNGGSVKWNARNVFVNSASSGFNADQRGFAGVISSGNKHTGYGPGAGVGFSGSYSSGAGHGGGGGAGRPDIAPRGAIYDEEYKPILAGSVGGRPKGGAGGGVVWIEAPEGRIYLNGRITANAGNAGESHSSGGSGGSIYLLCKTYEDTATAALQAKGGNTTTDTSNLASGGGGGRIAVVGRSITTNSLDYVVTGGTTSNLNGGEHGGLGTLVFHTLPPPETTIIIR